MMSAISETEMSKEHFGSKPEFTRTLLFGKAFKHVGKNEHILEINKGTNTSLWFLSIRSGICQTLHCFSVANLLRSTSVSRYTAWGVDLHVREQ